MEIMKQKQKQKKAAKAAMGCLVLLLLYGCASHIPHVGKADQAFLTEDGAEADFSWGGGAVSGEVAADSASGGNRMAFSGKADGATGSTGLSGKADEANGKADSIEENAPQQSEALAVYVCGAVKNPGVYELSVESRVYEAIELAGGMTAEASPCCINQAEKLSDGQMIVVLTEEEAKDAQMASKEETDGLVNINTADAEGLKALPGIGDAKAAAIIAYREKNGAFALPADIKKVDGIGDGVFAKLEAMIKVD